MPSQYRDRQAAGQVLAQLPDFQPYMKRKDVMVLALPRGGVPVAYELSEALDLPLDLMLVRKIGTPGHEELAMGAIAAGGIVYRNQSVIRELNIDEQIIGKTIALEEQELARRNRLYRDGRPPPEFKEKTIILIDDGLATGSTMHAAIKAAMTTAKAIVVAVPVGPTDTLLSLRAQPGVEAVICPWTPEPFGGVGRWYEQFEQVSDEQVRNLLDMAWRESD